MFNTNLNIAERCDIWHAIAADIEHSCLHENNFKNPDEYLTPEVTKVFEKILEKKQKEWLVGVRRTFQCLKDDKDEEIDYWKGKTKEYADWCGIDIDDKGNPCQ